MVCAETGRVIEFFDDEIEQRQRAVAAAHGFELVDHSLVLYVKPKSSP
jgi:Fur family ferric uptake transcriptional regulator